MIYAPKIDKAEARIDWSRPAGELVRMIHGLAPFPGAWFELEGERLKLLRAEAAQGSGAPGTVLDEDFAIACGSGTIRPVLDRTFPLDEVAAAYDCARSGSANGKVAVAIR